ncbi:MAG TPA: LapA family protein [Candidatus Dormibacteraeota bacterium]|nr:LapA family protein [Candidatus Dormibacteraeota bacterium]
MSNLWQRLLRATALVFGLAVGVGVTVFAYSNTASVNVGWANLHFDRVPLWTVAVVPLAIALAVGALYHWANNLHHFTEHMRHRRRVKELETELASLKSHLDTALAMPDHAKVEDKAKLIPDELAAEAPQEPAPILAANGDDKATKKSRKPPAVLSDTETVAVADVDPRPETPAET